LRATATLLLLGIVALAVAWCISAAINSTAGYGYVCGTVVLALVALYLGIRVVSWRSRRAVEFVLLSFLAAINRSDHEALLALMYAPQREALTPERLAAQFPEYIAECEILRAQITNARSARGAYGKLGKFLVRLDRQSGSSTDYVILMAQKQGVWKIDSWQEGDNYDMIDYAME